MFQFQEPSGTCLDSGGEFLQGVQEAFTQEWDEAHLSQRLEKGVQEQVRVDLIYPRAPCLPSRRSAVLLLESGVCVPCNASLLWRCEAFP